MLVQRGLYFEEFQVGKKIESPARTVTEAVIVNFAGLSGDYMQIHTDEEFARSTPYQKRIAHGLLVMAIASGLAARTGVLEGTVLAFREILNWKFIKPVFIGDTVYVELEVKDTKEMKRIGAGAVEIDLRVINQSQEIVMRGVWNILVSLKPSSIS